MCSRIITIRRRNQCLCMSLESTSFCFFLFFILYFIFYLVLKKLKVGNLDMLE
jgi:hypothetical protein